MHCARSAHSWELVVQAKTIAAELGVGFLALGFDPKWRVKDVPIMPKDRYRWGQILLSSAMATQCSQRLSPTTFNAMGFGS